jgi:hypothetical protein
MAKHSVVPADRVERSILVVRNTRVILDKDLAAFYRVATKRLNEQVKRNSLRFPHDFVFQLTEDECRSLRSQNATLETGRGRHRKYHPYAFTEHGALMAASVLSSRAAIEMSVMIVRAFVRLRAVLATHRELAAKLVELEHKLSRHGQQIGVLFEAIREIMTPPVKPKRGIGFGRGTSQVESPAAAITGPGARRGRTSPAATCSGRGRGRAVPCPPGR